MILNMATDTVELYSMIEAAVSSGSLRRAVFSGPGPVAGQILRVDIRPVTLRGQTLLQFASRTATQEFHRNCLPGESLSDFQQLLDGRYRNVFLELPSERLQGVLGPRGNSWKLHRQPTVLPAAAVSADSLSPPAVPAHDRQPNYIIPAGVPCAFLQACGLMDQRGNVKAAQSRKFRQINRFLEFVHDIAEVLPCDRQIRVVDFGCGKSYLTFAVHYLLKTVLKRDCRITGLDRRSDVVSGCQRIAERLELPELDFQVGDIASFTPDVCPDLVISLHACDTATDDALSQAIRWSAAAILAVPCCQQELQRKLPAGSLPPLTSSGIARERFCSLATDTQRASLLDVCGYQTQLLEFIDMEHTPKNLLLRAIRIHPRPPERVAHEQRVYSEATAFRQMLQIPPLALERQLLECGLLANVATSGTPGGSVP